MQIKKILILVWIGALGVISCSKESATEMNQPLTSRAGGGGGGGGTCLLINSFTAKATYPKGRIFPTMDANWTVKPCVSGQTMYVKLEVINASTNAVKYSYQGLPLISTLTTPILYNDYPPANTSFIARLSVFSDLTMATLLEVNDVFVSAPPKVKP